MKVLDIAMVVAFEVIGVVVCYQANRRGDGKNFLERYICLQVPLSIRFLVLGLMFVVLFSLLFGNLLYNLSSPLFINYFFQAITVVIYVIYIVYLRNDITKVAALPDASDTSVTPSACD
jgi:ABC-type sulfate transport system permease subunit